MSASRLGRCSTVLALAACLVIGASAAEAAPAFHLIPPLTLGDLGDPDLLAPGSKPLAKSPTITIAQAAAPASPTAAPAQPPPTQDTPATPAPAANAATGGAAAGAPAPAADLNFDLFDDKKPTVEQQAADAKKILALEKKSRIRRRVIAAHQAIGFATLALLATTVVLGQLNYYDKFASGGDYTGKFDTPHYVLSVGATAGFTVTGLLGLFAPNPYPKPIHFDTALVHKIAMTIAAACFAAEIVLGPVSAQFAPGRLDQRALAQAHLGLGYAAMGFMTIGTLVYVF